MDRFFWKQSVQCKNFTNNIGQILISHISPLCPVGKCVCSKQSVFSLTRAKRDIQSEMGIQNTKFFRAYSKISGFSCKQFAKGNSRKKNTLT